MTPETEKKTKSSPATDTIPFLNLKKLFMDHREEFLQQIHKVLDQAAYIGGEEIAIFERQFANWIGEGNFVSACGNGTDAITLATLSLGLPEGSEFIAPAMTYVASVEGVVHTKLKPVLVDVCDGTWLLDPKKVEKAITPKTKLIVAVHLYGQMAAMDELRTIADKHGIKILEDAAQAHGSLWKKKPVGFYGDVASYSFYPGKNVGAFGDAGAVLSRDAKRVEYCKALTNHGGLRKYEHNFIGFNSRLDTVQAAVLNVKLKYIDSWNENRRKIASQYYEELSGLSGLVLPVEQSDAKHTYHLFVVQVENRVEFGDFLKKNGIETGIHYPKAIHQLPAFGSFGFAKESFPNAEKIAAKGISIPMCPTLRPDQVSRITKTIRTYFGK